MAKSLCSQTFIKGLWSTPLSQSFRGTGSSQEAGQRTALQTYLELHGGKSVEDFTHVLSDDGPRDLVVTLSCGFYSTACHVIKCNHVGKHSHCFIERAEPDGIEENLSGILVNRILPWIVSWQRVPACFNPGIFHIYCQRRGAASNKGSTFLNRQIIGQDNHPKVDWSWGFWSSTQTFRHNRREQEPLLYKSHISICANANK